MKDRISSSDLENVLNQMTCALCSGILCPSYYDDQQLYILTTLGHIISLEIIPQVNTVCSNETCHFPAELAFQSPNDR